MERKVESIFDEQFFHQFFNIYIISFTLICLHI